MVVYKIVGQTNRPVWTKRSDILKWLGNNFINYIPNFFLPSLTRDTWETYRDVIFEKFKQMGYGLDGIVLTRENALYVEDNNSLVYDEVAFKFAAETANTIIDNINWTITRTNRLVPVAEVQPVELSGAVIHHCTCNNAKWVKDLGLGKGANVVITRSNEVIPVILEVIEESEEPLPDVCPVCKQPLIWNGVDLACNNDSCYSREYYNLQQWCEVIGETDSFAWLLMRQYLDKFDIGTLEDLYNKEDEILDWFRKSELSITDHKAYEFFMKIYVDKVNIEKALLALNIPRLGDKTVQILGQEEELILRFFDLCLKDKYYSYDVDFTDEINKFIELIKDANTKSLLENKDKFINLKYLINKDRLIFNKKQDKSEIKYIAVTGALESMKRKDFEKYIKQYGYELTSNLKKCKYLVNNDINSTSTKNKEAKQYGIPIITEQEFLSSLN